ncbi:immunodominant staphylococcal antigen IsaB family protein [Staphylococcus warneri]|uniref:immunodominant staphylococcal antigen IsaB family protein n=1 Tax=Staphylococcus warneri TaxID=1292 RepID=UPI00384EF2DA
MNKTAKAIVSSTLAIGTVFGVGASLDVNPNQDVHAATTPYYNYKGYVNNEGSFLLNKSFKNAVKYGNVTFNGTKIVNLSGTSSKINDFTKYDQSFSSIKPGKKQATSVHIKVNNITIKQLKSVYGNDLQEMRDIQGNKHPNTDSYQLKSPKTGFYHTPVTISQKNGQVTSVTIGFDGSGA